jgi:hypothetical protein
MLPPAVIKKHNGNKLESIKQKEFRKQVGSYKEAGRMALPYRRSTRAVTTITWYASASLKRKKCI